MKRIGAKWKPTKTLSRMTRAEMQAFDDEHEGDFIAIPIDGAFCFGRFLPKSGFAFYELRAKTVPRLAEIEKSPILFILSVSFEAMTSGRWRMIGNKPLDKMLSTPVKYFRNPRGTGYVDIYVDGKFQPYAGEDLTKMERLTAWSPKTVESRLRCHFIGSIDDQTEHSKIPSESAVKLRREYFERQAALNAKK